MFDTFVLHALTREIEENLTSMRVQRVLSPAPMTFLLRFRKDRQLLISLDASRCYGSILGEDDKESDQPTPYSIYLRKMLQGAKLVRAEQRALDRVLDLTFLATTPTLEKVTVHLIAEFMGRHANLIFTDAQYQILQALKYTPHLSESQHIVRIGKFYSDMPSDKEHPLTSLLPSSSFKQVGGYSPRLMRLLPEEIKERPMREISAWLLGSEDFTLFIGDDGRPFDYHRFTSEIFVATHFPTISEAMNAFYRELSKKEHTSAAKRRLEQILARRMERAERKLALQLQEMEEAKGAKEFKEAADILLANLYSLPNRAARVEVYDFYKEEMRTLALKERLTIRENAALLYKQYEKSQRAKRLIEEQIEKSRREIDILGQLRYDLSIASSAAEIASAESAASSEGYLPVRKSKKVLPLSGPRVYCYADARYLVGRSGAQNLELTMRHGERDHLWFHAKDIPGSHVVLELKEEEATSEQLHFGAKLAAFYSKSQGSPVSVDRTELRHVRRQKGGPQGSVTYVKQRSIIAGAGAEEILPYEKK